MYEEEGRAHQGENAGAPKRDEDVALRRHQRMSCGKEGESEGEPCEKEEHKENDE